MAVKEFSIVYDEKNGTWVATHNVLSPNKIFVCDASPVKALTVLLSKLGEAGEKPDFCILEKTASAMEKIVKIISEVDSWGDPLVGFVPLKFVEGMVGEINGELLGMYTEQNGEPRFILSNVEGMDVSFKIALFNEKQLSYISVIDTVESYDSYKIKYAVFLKEKGLE